MSPVSAKTSAPSASQGFTCTKGVALISALKASPHWTTPWSVEVRATTDTKKKKVLNLLFVPFYTIHINDLWLCSGLIRKRAVPLGPHTIRL